MLPIVGGRQAALMAASSSEHRSAGPRPRGRRSVCHDVAMRLHISLDDGFVAQLIDASATAA